MADKDPKKTDGKQREMAEQVSNLLSERIISAVENIIQQIRSEPTPRPVVEIDLGSSLSAGSSRLRTISSQARAWIQSYRPFFQSVLTNYLVSQSMAYPIGERVLNDEQLVHEMSEITVRLAFDEVHREDISRSVWRPSFPDNMLAYPAIASLFGLVFMYLLHFICVLINPVVEEFSAEERSREIENYMKTHPIRFQPRSNLFAPAYVEVPPKRSRTLSTQSVTERKLSMSDATDSSRTLSTHSVTESGMSYTGLPEEIGKTLADLLRFNDMLNLSGSTSSIGSLLASRSQSQEELERQHSLASPSGSSTGLFSPTIGSLGMSFTFEKRTRSTSSSSVHTFHSVGSADSSTRSSIELMKSKNLAEDTPQIVFLILVDANKQFEFALERSESSSSLTNPSYGSAGSIQSGNIALSVPKENVEKRKRSPGEPETPGTPSKEPRND